MNRDLTGIRLLPRLVGILLAGSAMALIAQQPQTSSVAAQREAMKKLAFLAGNWSGPVSISRGPGEPLKLTQTESVQFKLDGLVLLIQGKSAGPDGKAQFQALATVSYDDAAHVYRFRAYNDGRYVDTELTVNPDGFAWGFNAGPAKIQNTMHLNPKGEWHETTDVSFASNPPHRSVEMLLTHEQ
ncbi:MAG: hypothetical protein WCA10_10555 [Terracidiphilus sp.]